MANRTKEFDRAPSTIGFLKPFVPNSSIVKFTTPEFRTQRRLWMDVMTPDFLRRVAAPQMYKASQGLVELLRTRSAIADGRPFFVADDFELATLDAIWASLLGSDLKGVATEIAQIRSGAAAIK
jgi:cytochrome P450